MTYRKYDVLGFPQRHGILVMYTTTRQSNLNTMLSVQNSTTFSTFRLTAVHETASTIESDAAIKPIVSMCVPLMKAPRHWTTPLCPTKQHQTDNMSSVEHCRKNRDGRPDKPQKTTFEMHIGTYGHPRKITSHNNKNSGPFSIGALQTVFFCWQGVKTNCVVHSPKHRSQLLNLLNWCPTPLVGCSRILGCPVKNRSLTTSKTRTNDGCPKKDANSHSSSVTTTTDKTHSAEELSNTQTQEQNRLNGQETLSVHQKPETGTDSRATLWLKTHGQNKLRSHPVRSTVPARNKHFRERTDAAMLQHWQRWDMEHPSTQAAQLRIPSRTNMLRALSAENVEHTHRAHASTNIDWRHATRPTRTPKGTEKTPTSMQHPRAQTSTRWHFLRTMAMTVQTLGIHVRWNTQWMNRNSFNCSTNVFVNISNWGANLNLRNPHPSRWRLFELEDEQSKDAHEQTSSQHDTTLETSLRWKTCIWTATSANRDATICQTATIYASSIWASFRNKRALRNVTSYHTHQKKTWTPCVLEIWQSKTVQTKSSRRQQMFTHGHTLWREHEARTLK